MMNLAPRRGKQNAGVGQPFKDSLDQLTLQYQSKLQVVRAQLDQTLAIHADSLAGHGGYHARPAGSAVRRVVSSQSQERRWKRRSPRLTDYA